MQQKARDSKLSTGSCFEIFILYSDFIVLVILTKIATEPPPSRVLPPQIGTRTTEPFNFDPLVEFALLGE